MTTTSYSICDFLTACRGNWRNAIFIPCTPCGHACKNGRKGCLLTTDSSGRIRVVRVHRFEAATGQKIDPAECAGVLGKDAFEAAFQTHLIWKVDDPQQCALRQLDDMVSSDF
nr:hypothetical protein [uncultured Oscillibacter sp.]